MVEAHKFRQFSLLIAALGYRRKFDFDWVHDVNRALLCYKQPMQSKPVNHPGTYLFSLSPVLWHVRKRYAMLDVPLTHALQQLTKASSEVKPNRRRLAFCFDVPCVLGCWVSTKKVDVG